VVAELGACLELVLQLQQLQQPDSPNTPSPIVIEWPQGTPLQVVTGFDAKALRLSVGTDPQGWFALSGELAVDATQVVALTELLALVAASPHRFIPLSPGRFLALTERFRAQLATLSKVVESRKNKLLLHPWAGQLLEPLADDATLDAAPGYRKHVEARHEAARATPAVPRAFKATLRDYQRDGFRWLARLGTLGVGACLADDMGLGKTVQALALLVSRAKAGPQLVVCPTSVVGGWLDEATRFAPTLRFASLASVDRTQAITNAGPLDVLVVTYGLLQIEVEALASQRWQTVILDEAQAIKNPDSQRAKAASRLSAAFRVALTGTPIENRLDELWSLFHFLVPGLLGSRRSFAERFGPGVDRRERIALRQLVHPLMLRRTKSEVLDELPPRTDMLIEVDLGEREAALYEALRQRALTALAAQPDELAGPRRFRVLAEITRLRRACCHPRLVLDDGASDEGLVDSAKLAALAELVTDLREGGHRALIYSQFVDHLQVVREWVEQEGIAYQYLDGSTPMGQRQERVRAFQAGEGELFLISLRAGGTGLNLTGADFVIHLDPWWNPAVEDQASDRVHRIGQERPVTVVRLIARHSIEERILALHRDKRELADELLAGADSAAHLTVDALIALIA
jgi:SNF2 family DNA or RNA helicase